MAERAKILVVDDTPHNVKLLVDLLGAHGFDAFSAASGPEALERIAKEPPDLVLLDVMMPEMNGYDLCRAIREDAATSLLPVVMVTALDPQEERVKGIEAGADDFLSKPINSPELLARVRSLLRIRELHETVRAQASQLEAWNERLKRFLSPQLADLVASDGMEMLRPHRRRVAVVFVDLRGFTAFAEVAEPEEMMDVLREYHAEMGRIVTEHEGTLERFTGDGLMIFFNDPVEVPDPEARAVRMAIEMRDGVLNLRERWTRLGHELGVGIGITAGYATLGAIGFEGRWDYAAIGTVTNQAARLCDAAEDGQILVSQRLLARVEDLVEARSIGELALRGFRRPVPAHDIHKLR